MNDICSTNASKLLSLDDALYRIKTSLTPLPGTEVVSINNALGRILAESVISACNLPGFTNSSMDGFAFCSKDIAENKPFILQLSGTSWAGKPYLEKISSGSCARIFTGAVLPAGTDSVVIQEQVNLLDNARVQFPKDTVAFQNIRYPGEDIKQGDKLFKPDKKLTAVDISLLASTGLFNVRVKRKIKIAYLSTGDELVPVGSKISAGKIYDSNRYALKGLLENYAWESTDLGVIPDDKSVLKNCLTKAAQIYDVIITTGGASVGEADYIKQILDEIGNVNFWKIAIKPGKPLAYGQIGTCCFFGLPGNPVSVIATYQQIVAPSLQQLSGANSVKPLRLKAKCNSSLKKIPGRKEFQRGILSQLEDGEFSVTTAGKQGSHILSSMSQANCYIVLSETCSGVNQGEFVEVEPFTVTI